MWEEFLCLPLLDYSIVSQCYVCLYCRLIFERVTAGPIHVVQSCTVGNHLKKSWFCFHLLAKTSETVNIELVCHDVLKFSQYLTSQ